MTVDLSLSGRLIQEAVVHWEVTMFIPILKSVHVMSEDWKDGDDFWVGIDAYVGTDDSQVFEYEVFSFQVVSPKRLQRVLEDREIEVGRGLLITNDYDLRKVESTITRLVSTCSRSSWEQTVMALNCFGCWQE